jgi:hypothetical protein
MKIPVIIHVMHDEKFNDMAIRQFEAVGACINEYWITSDKLNLTKSPLARACNQEDLYHQVRRSDVAGVIFHSLPPWRYRLLNRIPQGKCVVWLGWGYDYYFFINGRNARPLIMKKTDRINRINFIKKVGNKLRHELDIIRHPSLRKPEILRRVDIFSPVLDVEFDMVKNYINLSAKYIEWNYGTAEDDLTLPGVDFANGSNILAGNSASATNNHIELFEAIRDQVDLSGRKIITPLSYGEENYRKKVIEAGGRILGDSFFPLTSFMAVTDYLKIVKSCGFVAMNHRRQQAVGNVCMGMLAGAKIFLNDESPLSSWLRTRGAKIGTIDEIDMEKLSAHDQKKNAEVVYAHWGRQVQINRTRYLINKILSHVH